MDLQSRSLSSSLTRKFKFRAEYLFVRSIALILSCLNRSSALTFGKWLGFSIGKLLSSRLKIAKKNILESFPHMREENAEQIIYDCWKNLGEGVAEFVKIPDISANELDSFTEISGMEYLQQSYRAGKGVVIATAHFGAWELGAKVWPKAGFDTAVIARKVKNPLVNAWVTKIRETDGARVINARDGVRESIRWLKSGKMLAILMDHRITEGGLELPFFGRPASTTSLPAILALRYQIPIHPVHCWREGEKVRVQIDPAMNFNGLTASDEGIWEASLQLNQIVENWVRENPAAWLWIHNRWKH